jgi:acetyltransferase-like isoleucine patch superfamily enzyme
MIKKIINNLRGKTNSLRHLFFTKDIFNGKKYTIGDYSYGHPKILFENESTNLTIGKFCSIADGVTVFLGGNHRTDWISTYPFNKIDFFYPESLSIIGHPATKGNVIIGNDVWIGTNVIIMSGVTIDNGAVIAAGAVVTKNIGPYEIWGGNPARLLKKRFDDETINELQKIAWWNWDIKEIRENIPHLCNSNIQALKKK